MTSATLSTLSTATFALALALVGVFCARLKWVRRISGSETIDAPGKVAAEQVVQLEPVPRRVAAISGSDFPYAVSARSIARQAAPYHTRPMKYSTGKSPTAVPLALVARRPGLAKQPTRIDRRLAVVR